MPILTHGVLIAIEGIDGSGKSTLAQNLFTELKNQQYNALLTKEPGDSALGQKIREIVQTDTVPVCPVAEFLLFAADRAQHFSEVIIPALYNKTLIISDRLSDSSLAYQGYARGLNKDMLQTINQWAMSSIAPNLTIFVRIPVNIALQRITHRSALSTFEKESFLEKVAHGFETLYQNKSNVIIIDGTKSAETILQETVSAVKKWIVNKEI